MTQQSCTGAILAGGGATRFGAPKGLATVAGRRILDRVYDAVHAAADDVLLVSNEPRPDEWLPGVKSVADVSMQRGSMVGIHTALIAAGTPVLLVAWDMPFVNTDLLAEMRAVGELHGAPVIPVLEGGPEPMCAYYTPECIPELERRLRAGELRAGDAALALPGAIPLRDEAVARFGDPRRLFFNVNTAADLATARQMANAPM